MTGAGAAARRFPLGWVVLLVAVAVIMVRTVDVLLIFFLSVLLAVYLDAVAGLLERRADMPRGVGLLTGLLLSLGALVGAVLLIIPPLSEQVQGLISNLPTYLAALDRNLASMLQQLPLLRRGAPNPTSTSILSSALLELVGFLRTAAVPYLKRGFDLIIELVSVLVMAIYLVRHPSIYVDGAVALVPPPHRPLARIILGDLRITLRAWVVGQIIAMVVLAVLTTLLLWLVGLPYFLAFGTFAGIAAIVPIFGTLFSTVIPALFALGSSGLGLALAVAAVGVGVHLVEANFVSPYVMERQVNVPPVLTILGVLLMGKLFGPVGLIIAVPTLATVMVLVRHILLGTIYGDPIDRIAPAGTVAPGQPRTITAEPEALPTRD